MFRKRIATEREQGYQHILNRLKLLHDELVASVSGQPSTFGIGTPGHFAAHRFVEKFQHRLHERPAGEGRPGKTAGPPIEIQNDANCFAMAEALMGAGKDKELVFGVIIGTGCGGGIVYKGEVFTGPQAIAGEWGHMSIDPNGPLCFCGHRGCVETLISGADWKIAIRAIRRQKPLKEIEKEFLRR
jgi:fructokinase